MSKSQFLHTLMTMNTLIRNHGGILFYHVQILWRGQEKIMADSLSPEEWDKQAGIKVVDGI